MIQFKRRRERCGSWVINNLSNRIFNIGNKKAKVDHLKIRIKYLNSKKNRDDCRQIKTQPSQVKNMSSNRDKSYPLITKFIRIFFFLGRVKPHLQILLCVILYNII